MPKVVTFSVFLPSASSSSAVCANAVSQAAHNINAASIFFMTASLVELPSSWAAPSRGAALVCFWCGQGVDAGGPDQLFVGTQFGNDVLLHIGGRHRHRRIASDRPPLGGPSVC